VLEKKIYGCAGTANFSVGLALTQDQGGFYGRLLTRNLLTDTFLGGESCGERGWFTKSQGFTLRKHSGICDTHEVKMFASMCSTPLHFGAALTLIPMPVASKANTVSTQCWERLSNVVTLPQTCQPMSYRRTPRGTSVILSCVYLILK